MNIPLETLRETVSGLYQGTAYGYVVNSFGELNSRQLQAFEKLAASLDMSKNTRLRYVDVIQKAKVDALVRLCENENLRRERKKLMGAISHVKRFNR